MKNIITDMHVEIASRLQNVSKDANLSVKLFPVLARDCAVMTGSIHDVAAQIFSLLQHYCQAVPSDQGRKAESLIREIVVAVGGEHGEAIYQYMADHDMLSVMPVQ